jgi:8-oxo-dGTP pyrophosphatase MutT (NUDIX family)
MAETPHITADLLRQRLAATRMPGDLLDVVMPAGSDRWPPGIRDKLTTTLTPAGVLIPVIQHAPSELALLLTQRAADLKHHAGQVSFPGGRMEAADANIAITALRETEEEVGIAQAKVAVIGYLQPMPTVTGYAVTPVVGLIDGAVELRLDRTEVEYVFEVPLRFLLDRANRRIVERELHGNRVSMVEYHFEGQRIWGATAFIIEKFIKILI